jgi:HAD superfamily hydrolase (TIGR01509 family)
MMTWVATVLFDLGGVVCRFHLECRLRALASDCGLSDLEVRVRIWDSGFDRDCDRGRYSAHEVYQRIRAILGLKATYHEFRRMWALAFQPDPAVLALVDTLQSEIRRGLLTDNGPVLRDAISTLFPEISQRFEPLLFSCELGALKPTTELFTGVLEHLNQRAEQILLVDDSSQVVQEAIAFGFHAYLYDSPGTLQRELMKHGLSAELR